MSNAIRMMLRRTGELTPVIPTNFTLTIDTSLGDGDLTFQFAVVNAIGNIDLGDGNILNNTTTGSVNLSHTYTTAGVYKVVFLGTIEEFIGFDNFTDNEKITQIDFGTNYGVNSTDQQTNFRSLINCTEISSGTGDFSAVTSFRLTFTDTPITKFPANVFDTCPTTDFRFTFIRCALDQQSVDNIITSINTARLAGAQSGSTKRIDMQDGTNATPSLAVQSIVDDMRTAGWIINLNGY